MFVPASCVKSFWQLHQDTYRQMKSRCSLGLRTSIYNKISHALSKEKWLPSSMDNYNTRDIADAILTECCLVFRSTYRGRVLKRRVNLRLAKEHVAAACAPQHPFERGDALAQDHSRDKTKQNSC